MEQAIWRGWQLFGSSSLQPALFSSSLPSSLSSSSSTSSSLSPPSHPSLPFLIQKPQTSRATVLPAKRRGKIENKEEGDEVKLCTENTFGEKQTDQGTKKITDILHNLFGEESDLEDDNDDYELAEEEEGIAFEYEDVDRLLEESGEEEEGNLVEEEEKDSLSNMVRLTMNKERGMKKYGKDEGEEKINEEEEEDDDDAHFETLSERVKTRKRRRLNKAENSRKRRRVKKEVWMVAEQEMEHDTKGKKEEEEKEEKSKKRSLDGGRKGDGT